MSAKVSPITDSRKAGILLVDEYPIFREGLALIIGREKDLAVRAECEDAASALKKARAAKPDLAIIDISLEGMNGIELTKSLRSALPRMRILVFSMQKELLYAERALAAGANGYIMKKCSREELMAAIRCVLKGETYVSDVVKEHILRNVGMRHGKASSPVGRLSQREFEVFELIARGYGSRHIAAALHLSTKTVETHRQHIREKLNIGTSFELVQYAHEWATSLQSRV